MPRPYKAKARPRNDKIKAKKKTLKAIATVASLPRNDWVGKGDCFALLAMKVKEKPVAKKVKD